MAGWEAGRLGAPVVGELELDAEILALEQGDDRLEVIAVLSRHPDRSAWMDAWTFIFASLIAFTTSLAFSVGIPCWIVTFWRTVPPSAGSTLP